MQTMIKSIICGLTACFILQNTAFAAHDPFRLLITTFDPFQGRSQNNTQAIAAQIKQILPTQFGKAIDVRVCNLSVVYDLAASQAMKCIDDYQPDAVVTLGEAYCDIRLETAATNSDNTPNLADNSGQIRNNRVITPGGPRRTGFMFPIADLFCAFQPNNPPNTMVSHDPGYFVCNNTAYHLGEKLKVLNIPFTLIHVPNSQCSANQVDPKMNAKTITTMLLPAIKDITLPGNNYPSMPTGQQEALYYINALLNQHAPNCAITFAKTLAGTY